MRRVAPFVCALAIATATCDARADEPTGTPSPDPQRGALYPVLGDDDPHDEFEAFPLVRPHGKHYLRAGLEVGSVVIVGFVDYLLNTAARGGDVRAGDERWALRYEWSDLRGKLVGSAYELDANRFGTNYASHPFAGAMYFHAARSNHLSFAESYLFAVLGSSMWEYFFEIREKVSVNDMFVTPMAGAVLGEATMQLSGFFARGKKNAPNAVLSFLFAPLKVVNDALDDDSEPLRTTRPDALGLATEPWHRFEARAGMGATLQHATPKAQETRYADVHLGLDLELANLPGYRNAGRHARLFDDGNVSSMHASATLSEGHLVSGLLAARVVPIGFYVRDAVDAGGGPSGSGAVVGLRTAFEYGVHEFDRDRTRASDQIAIVSPVGVAAEYVLQRGRLRLRTGIDVGGSIAGVRPYALSDYRASRELAGLPTAVQNNGYYHALSFTAAPSLELGWGPVQVEIEMRLDAFRAIEGLDAGRDERDRSLPLDDRRALLRAAVSLQPAMLPFRLSVGARRMLRTGDVGTVHASRAETSIWGSLGVVF